MTKKFAALFLSVLAGLALCGAVNPAPIELQ